MIYTKYIRFLDDGNTRQFVRVQNNEVCEARGGDCKRLMDVFAKHLKKPNPIPEDLYQKVNYHSDLKWIIMSSEGTGKGFNVWG